MCGPPMPTEVSQARETASLAEHDNARLHPTRGSKSGNHQGDVVAYVSSHVLDIAQGQWGRRQSCTGSIGALNGQDDPGHLHAGSQSAEACGTEQSGQHDLAKPKLYRRCTASFW